MDLQPIITLHTFNFIGILKRDKNLRGRGALK